MKWLTSDQHFGHNGILWFCSRPFKTVEEMDDTIVANFNACVASRDEVYHLGDFAWKDADIYLGRLHGIHHLILGNHDRKHVKDLQIFDSVQDVAIVKLNHQSIFCSHYAHARWPASHKGRPHAFGHSHGNFMGLGRSIDVGVDCNGFHPLSFDEVFERCMMKSFDFNHGRIE